MEKINIVGNIFSKDGYASHTGQLAKALDKIADVAIECPLFPGWESATDDKLRDMLEKHYESETTIFIGLPNYWRLKLSDRPKRFYGFFVWECMEVPECYVEIMNDKRIDGILVSAESVKDACVRSGVTTPIHVINHGVNLEYFFPEKVERDSRFTFLFNKGWINGKDDRSGFDILLKAFTEEFTKEDNVLLIAKLNPAYIPPGWDINKELKKLDLDFNNCPEIRLNFDFVNFKSLNALYNQADVCVIPSKGEGFGLTYIEAMACKVPCIATRFGGHLDFINDDNGWLVDCKITQATGNFLTENCHWMTPDVEHLKKILRDVYTNHGSKDFMIKKRLAFETAQKFTWSKSAEKLIKIIKDER